MFTKLLVIYTFVFICCIQALGNFNLEECMKATGVKVTPNTLKQLHDANKGGNFDINSIPDEMLCLPKCVLEKKGIIDSTGNILVEKLENDQMLERIPNKKAFLECMGKIKGVSTCEDVKKILECRVLSQK
ncbi:uncharacterized protein LOC123684391 [Harmonia axyridis]|uniref:Odorant binding protein 4 n=1 Tax=Harmonia axyridis TaxID=115357 RepID=A0A8K1AMN5_HARAX|nr:uncharacterized protein LOC123684391 [Harmonia axyridis]QTE76112.1 odorant binding protein 4 [Harmonia axyridis]